MQPPVSSFLLYSLKSVGCLGYGSFIAKQINLNDYFRKFFRSILESDALSLLNSLIINVEFYSLSLSCMRPWRGREGGRREMNPTSS